MLELVIKILSKGDGRHVLITLLDLYQQLKDLNPSQAGLKVQMLLNDLNPTAIARLVVLFLGLEEMSRFDHYDRSNPDFSFCLWSLKDSSV